MWLPFALNTLNVLLILQHALFVGRTDTASTDDCKTCHEGDIKFQKPPDVSEWSYLESNPSLTGLWKRIPQKYGTSQRQNAVLIPYRFQPSYSAWSQKTQDAVRAALMDLSRRTNYCFQFFESPVLGTKRLNFALENRMNVDRCWALMGSDADQSLLECSIVLSESCMEMGQIQHLLLHSLGLLHEDNRSNSDVRLTNTYPGLRNSIHFNASIRFPGNYTISYDPHSIMHSQNKRNRSLSARDVLKLQSIYNCQPQNYITELVPTEDADKDNWKLIEPKNKRQYRYRSIQRIKKFVNIMRFHTEDPNTGNLPVEFIRFYPEANETHLKQTGDAFRNHGYPFGIILQNNRKLLGHFSQNIMEDHIIRLRFQDYNKTLTSDDFYNITFKNVELLEFVNCSKVELFRNGLASFRKLKMIVFNETYETTLAKGAFTGLSQLKRVALDVGIAEKVKLGHGRIYDYLTHIRKVHCMCGEDRTWLRDLFRSKPTLIERAVTGEIYKYEWMQSPPFETRDMYAVASCNGTRVSVKASNPPELKRIMPMEHCQPESESFDSPFCDTSIKD